MTFFMKACTVEIIQTMVQRGFRTMAELEVRLALTNGDYCRPSKELCENVLLVIEAGFCTGIEGGMVKVTL